MDLVLGHNQFVGISHISESKSIEKKRHFDDVNKILKIVEYANEHGFNKMVLENHPILIELAKKISINNNLDMKFYIQIPYAQGYIKEANEKGIRGFVGDSIDKLGFTKGSGLVLKSAWNYLKSDYNALIVSTMKLEMSNYDNLKVDCVFLHNIVTDLLASLKMYDLLDLYYDEIKKDLGYDCGFITQNFHLLDQYLKSRCLVKSRVMLPMNIRGFGMNPSKEIVENMVRSSNYSISAMNVLGGGSYSMDESIDYVRKCSKVRDVVVGVSSREHILSWEEACMKNDS